MDQCCDVTSTSDDMNGVVSRRVSDDGTKTTTMAGGQVDGAGNTGTSTPTPTHGPRKTKPSPVWKKPEVKRYPMCEISSCGLTSDQLKYAQGHVLTFFGIRDRLAVMKVCPLCISKADEFKKKSIEALKSGRSLFSEKCQPQVIPETIDLDEAEDDDKDLPNNQDEVEVDFEKGEVEGIVKGILQKFNIKAQIDNCAKTALVEAEKLGKEFADLDALFKSVDDIVYDTSRRYHKTFDRRPRPLIIQEIDISADGSIRRRNMAGDKSVFINHSSMTKLASKNEAVPETDEEDEKEKGLQDKSVSQSAIAVDAATEFDALNTSVVSERKPGPASKTKYHNSLPVRRGPFEKKIQLPATEGKKFTLLNTPSIIPRVKPQVGDIVYAMNKNLLNYWLQAEIVETLHNQDTKQWEYIVRYEPTKNGKPTGRAVVEGDGSKQLVRQITLKQLAYNVPCPFKLPVGTRVIAKFRDELNMDPETDGHYYAGIIAEQCKENSKNRYLIFFDDGYAQYVTPDGILLVCEASKDVWADIHPDSYDFMKDYVTKFPDWPMVKLREGVTVPTEWNGKWLMTRILETDCSMVKVRFQNDDREEWIYRGSPRLRPIYRCLELEEKKNEQPRPVTNSIPRHDPTEFKNRNEPSVEYKYDDMPNDKKSARKSTGRFQRYDHIFGGITENHINPLDPDLCIEFQGSIKKIEISNNAPKPRNFTPHDCDSNCVTDYAPTKELKRISPLAVPLHLGWGREVAKSPRHTIFYRTPCGIRLRDYEELNKYLDETDCNLSVDYFCFDYGVDCLTEFVPARAFVDIKDISYGKETAPVQCLNSVDFDPLPFMEYISKRIPGPGVDINDDENFLTCCDCTDNCQDKSKCACWKLTMEGITFTKLYDKNCPVPGYENRRLTDHVVSGIYECNSKCHCKSTCSNRVVQNGVTWPLQVFKTTKKGWGIRTLYDMPEGTFLCIYAGQILTDQEANEGGMEFGDEYLAELDYIECNEDVKADYESDVTDIEAEDSEGDTSTKRSKQQIDGIEILGDSESEPENDCHASDTSFKSQLKAPQKGRTVATRRTDGRKQNFDILNNDDDIITARSASHFNPKISPVRGKRKRICLREMYGADEQCYIMDAKLKGNIGRYLNHSCKPNVFVQNVFVDTHDLRFPMVAFFTNSYVKAGTELTWDYHYQINSVPGKTMYCFCNTPYCRGRLL